MQECGKSWCELAGKKYGKLTSAKIYGYRKGKAGVKGASCGGNWIFVAEPQFPNVGAGVVEMKSRQELAPMYLIQCLSSSISVSLIRRKIGVGD